MAKTELLMLKKDIRIISNVFDEINEKKKYIGYLKYKNDKCLQVIVPAYENKESTFGMYRMIKRMNIKNCEILFDRLKNNDDAKRMLSQTYTCGGNEEVDRYYECAPGSTKTVTKSVFDQNEMFFFIQPEEFKWE